MNQLIFILIGIIGGISSGLLGIGTGTIYIPAMLYLANVPQHIAQGTALGAMIPIVLLGFWRYNKRKKIEMRAGIFLIIGSLAGVMIGSNTAIKIPADVLQKYFALFLIFIGIKMMYSTRRQDRSN